MKLLYILNFARRLNQFSYSSMLAAQALGYEFHVASNWSYTNEAEKRKDEEKYGIRIHQIDFMRNPLHPGNIKAYRQINSLMDHEDFQIVHCNTPIGGVLGRIAAKRHHIKAVIYQAHGFHFYQGASRSSWALYYPIEKFFARYSDCIITINKEDYELARKQLRPRLPDNVVYIPGIGIDIDRYDSPEIEPANSKEELGVPKDAIVAISVGELNRNKNHEVVIRAIQGIPHVHYMIAGIGPLHEKLIMLAEEQGIADRVHFLGYRSDIPHVYKASDIFCLPSYREGLSASLMEAMASGLPVICSDIRGNRDLVLRQGGYLINPKDVQGFAAALNELVSSDTKRVRMGKANRKTIEAFSINQVVPMMKSIYAELVERNITGTSG